ncbi:MAG: monovalent cation:H+ antiporter, family [Betaproteobacteria bacterium]|jgi:CPA1 family monovalent cation:H+ antiporter|nr:monovalent cation:H+ antiporter, family [Betaproteobacteria bacterium]
MDALSAAAALITLAALFSWLNHKYIRQPASIALLLFSLALSLALVALGKLGFDSHRIAERALGAVDLDRALLDSMLSFLLFAGALHVDLNELQRRRWAIGFLASLGVIVSAGLAACALWLIFGMLGHPLPFIWCLLFGALISPTDPIAVLAILKSAKAEKSLESKMAGEALLNDGFGVVLFVLFLSIAAGGPEARLASVPLLFVREILGGALLGLGLGYLCYRMLASVDAYQVEVFLTLALVMGGYALALAVHVSGPIAIVVAGVLIGTQGRKHAMSPKSRERLDNFWELIDEMLNAVLFVMIGLELLRLQFDVTYAWAAALAIPAVLVARFLSVGLAALIPGLRDDFPPYVVGILTWGGLRGGISVALALSLPSGPHRPAIITVTYVVVLFSILVQGLTLSRVLRRRSI